MDLQPLLYLNQNCPVIKTVRGCSDRVRGKGFKLKKTRIRLDIGKKFFTQRVVKHWHRLSRGAVDAPSLEVFKARLEGP